MSPLSPTEPVLKNSAASSENFDRESWSRNRGSLLVLFVVLLAQVWTLSRSHGYQLADSVEYMDRAWDVARGHGLGSGSARSFAFSSLLLPFFALADWLELESLKPIVWILRGLQMTVGLLTIRVLIRTATRLYSLQVAWVCALLLGLSPVFLRYTITPLSGPLAMLFMLLGFEALFAPPRLLAPNRFRQGLKAGCWMGLGMLVAYQTMLVAAPLAAIALLRDRLREVRFWLGFATIYIGLLLLQCFLDQAVYGKFGTTLLPYLGSNGGAIITRILWDLGLEDQGAWVYLNFVEHDEIRADYLDKSGASHQIQSMDWYVRNLANELLSWPIIVLVTIGIAAVAIRPTWIRAAITFTLLANATLMSLKGAKSFRLWLPILPLIALAAGDAVLLLRTAIDRKGKPLLRIVLNVIVAAGMIWGLGLAQQLELRRFGNFWSGMELINKLARKHNASVTVASSFHWATLFRAESGVKLIKLSHDLGSWQGLDEGARKRVLNELAGIDFFITHRQAIEQDPGLMEVIGTRYRLLDVFLDPGSAKLLGPVLVFGAPREDLPIKGRELFLHRKNLDPAELARIQSSIQHPSNLVFENEHEDSEPFAVAFLGWNLEPIPSHRELAWVTYYWWAREVDGRDYLIHDRLTDNLGREHSNHTDRAYGVLPTSAWEPRSLVLESYLIQTPRETRQYGGPYARGELIPLELYLSVGLEDDSAPDAGASLLPVFDSGGRHIAPPDSMSMFREPFRPIGGAGSRWNSTGMIYAGSGWLPAHEDPKFPAKGERP